MYRVGWKQKTSCKKGQGPVLHSRQDAEMIVRDLNGKFPKRYLHHFVKNTHCLNTDDLEFKQSVRQSVLVADHVFADGYQVTIGVDHMTDPGDVNRYLETLHLEHNTNKENRDNA